MRESRIGSVCAVPLVVGNRALGTLTVGRRDPDAFPPASVAVIEGVGRQVAMAVANALAFPEIAQLTEKLAEERLYLESEIRAEHPFAEIVGESPLLGGALQQVDTVAPTDATVLILGETGSNPCGGADRPTRCAPIGRQRSQRVGRTIRRSGSSSAQERSVA